MDSDGDGVSDGSDQCPGYNDTSDADGNGIPDGCDTDADGDTLPNNYEDLDNDGNLSNDDTDTDGIPNWLDDDDDGDTVSTSDEYGEGDTDNDGIADYLDNDDDNDTLLTANEDVNGDGNPKNDDTDSDGIPNYLDDDDDGDGILTKNESLTEDSDGDGIVDYLDGNVPIMVVSGKGVDIANRDYTPDTADGTEFGRICHNSSKMQSFIITNRSDASGNLLLNNPPQKLPYYTGTTLSIDSYSERNISVDEQSTFVLNLSCETYDDENLVTLQIDADNSDNYDFRVHTVCTEDNCSKVEIIDLDMQTYDIYTLGSNEWMTIDKDVSIFSSSLTSVLENTQNAIDDNCDAQIDEPQEAIDYRSLTVKIVTLDQNVSGEFDINATDLQVVGDSIQATTSCSGGAYTEVAWFEQEDSNLTIHFGNRNIGSDTPLHPSMVASILHAIHYRIKLPIRF